MATKKTPKRYTRTLTLPDGKRKYVYGHSKAEVEAKLAELKDQIAGGLRVDDDTTFGEIAKLWVEKYKAPFTRPSTMRVIKSQINTHLMPRFATMPIRSITQLMCQSLVADLAQRNLTTTNHIISVFRQILDTAVELGYLQRSPLTGVATAAARRVSKNKPKEEKEIMSPEVDKHLLATLQPMSREFLIFAIGRDTGMRRGEIAALNWDCIDLKSNVIQVRRNVVWDARGLPTVTDQLKTVHSRRAVPITPYLHTVLQSLADLGRDAGYVFPGNSTVLTQNQFQVAWGHIRSTAAQVDPEFAAHFTPHVMRHTYITRLFDAGLDIKEIQYLAGHSDISTTLNIYTHYTELRRETTFNKVRDIRAEQDELDNIIAFPVAQ